METRVLSANRSTTVWLDGLYICLCRAIFDEAVCNEEITLIALLHSRLYYRDANVNERSARSKLFKRVYTRRGWYINVTNLVMIKRWLFRLALCDKNFLFVRKMIRHALLEKNSRLFLFTANITSQFYSKVVFSFSNFFIFNSSPL